MKIESVNPPRSPSFDAVLRDDPASRPTDRFPYAPDLDGLAEAARFASRTRFPRGRVVDLLARYNTKVENHAGATLAERLRDPQSLVIATGQQPGLFGGPMMVFAKIAGAVTLSRQLEDRLGVPVVPLFWNHSEDHDLEEVNRFAWRDGASITRGKVPIEDRGASLDEIHIDGAVIAAAQEMLEATGVRPPCKELYLPRAEESYATWTSRVVGAVLADLPVVHLEPYAIRSTLGPLFSEWITAWKPLDEAVRAGITAVAAAGMAPQVVPDAPGHLFLRDEGGRRKKLRRIDDRWQWNGAEGLPDDADAWLQNRATGSPESFSCTALVRPLAQQAILPVVAQVNGPAEVAYFAQLPEVFEAAGLPLPAVMPRPSLTVLGTKEAQAANRFGLSTIDLVRAPDTWSSPDPTDEGARPDQRRFRHVLATLSEWEQELADTAPDEGVRRSVAGWAKKVGDATRRLEKSFEKASEQQSGAGRAVRHRLAEWVHPMGRPQERILGPLAIARGQDPALSGDILARIDPLDFRHHVVTLEHGDFQS